jgi:hypothetical protein
MAWDVVVLVSEFDGSCPRGRILLAEVSARLHSMRVQRGGLRAVAVIEW